MSMDLYIFSNRPVRSMAEWQSAIDDDGFQILLDLTTAFDDLNGFLPVRLDGAGTGFEVGHESAAELVGQCSEDDIDIGGPWACALAFHWGGDLREMIAAFSTASSYARVTEGVVFDPQEGEVFTPAAAFELARKLAAEGSDQLGPPRYEWPPAP
jgi:hypothetical protein